MRRLVISAGALAALTITSPTLAAPLGPPGALSSSPRNPAGAGGSTAGPAVMPTEATPSPRASTRASGTRAAPAEAPGEATPSPSDASEPTAITTAAPSTPATDPLAATWALTPDLAVLPYSDGAAEGAALRGGAIGVHAMRRFGPWGVGLAVEANLWRSEDFLHHSDYFVALLAGVEGERLSAAGRVRTRVGGGLAVLLEGTDNDEAGQAGFYIDIRPVGYRWELDGVVLVLDPLSLLTAVPAAGGIPLVDVQYRVCLSAEVGL